jgi:nucleotide-binding universal stress UspA family protein
MYKRILVALDGSTTSRRGLSEALGFGRLGDAVVLRLVCVVSSSIVALEYAAAGAASQDFLGDLRRAGNATLQEAMELCSTSNVRAEAVLLETSGDDTGELLVKEALGWPADLIVMGTHGRSGLRRLLLGSTAEFVLRHSPVPLLLVREAAQG